jgi:hypothetical protein
MRLEKPIQNLQKRSHFRLARLALVALLLVPVVLWAQAPSAPTNVQINAPAATPAVYYYVRTDGSNANNGLTNSSGGAFLTIDYALDNADPGDIIRVQAGHYQERLTPAVSGTSGNLITIVADGAASFCGVTLSSDNYIRVIGFTIDGDAAGCAASRSFDVAGTNTGWELWNNTIRDESVGIGSGSANDRNHNMVVIGNTFINIGSGTDNGTGISTYGNDSVFAYNEMNDVDPDQFAVHGDSNQYLNNYFHTINDTNTHHSDVFYSSSSTIGTTANVFEGNITIGNGALTDEHGTLMTNPSALGGTMTENLFRFNVWHRESGGYRGVATVTAAPVTETRNVNETIVDTVTTGSFNATATFNGTGITARAHNNIVYQGWPPGATTSIHVFWVQSGASFSSYDYNLAYDPDGSVSFSSSWTVQANELSNVDPSFANVASDDFTLQSGSAARNAGGPLTTTSGSGTGTTFNVAAGGGGFFRGPNTDIGVYGGALTQGDVITVGTDVVTVVSVSTDAITVTPSFTWANGDGVYYGTDATPDLGALPYKAGGYTLTATYATAGGVTTIAPSDASLVRFVVCYRDGVPYAADNASPFTCPVASGFTARVYPRYAVITRYVTATQE